MDKRILAGYAQKRISELDLGCGGPLGTGSVCVYTDVGDYAVRISDGRVSDMCRTNPEVDKSLQAWRDWLDKEDI